MLDVAIKHSESLKELFYSTWFNDRYKYYNEDCWYSDTKLTQDTYNSHQFVSIKDNKVIGYISYCICRTSNRVYDLGIINFEENPSLTFSRDLEIVLRDIFEKFNFNKLNFEVVVGNPVEKSYNIMCHKYGGRVVGTYKDHVCLSDGNLYDVKLYEISREDYASEKLKRRSN